MTKQRYDVTYEKEPRGQVVTDNGIPCTARTCCTRLNRLEEENEELKQQLIDEKVRTTPITLTTHISDEDFKKFEELLKKHYGGVE